MLYLRFFPIIPAFRLTAGLMQGLCLPVLFTAIHVCMLCFPCKVLNTLLEWRQYDITGLGWLGFFPVFFEPCKETFMSLMMLCFYSSLSMVSCMCGAGLEIGTSCDGKLTAHCFATHPFDNP